MSYYRKFKRSYSTKDRFDNYIEMLSKFASKGKCGHEIKKGVVIGYNSTHGAVCTDCWIKWKAENREAEAIEAGYINSPW